MYIIINGIRFELGRKHQITNGYGRTWKDMYEKNEIKTTFMDEYPNPDDPNLIFLTSAKVLNINNKVFLYDSHSCYNQEVYEIYGREIKGIRYDEILEFSDNDPMEEYPDGYLRKYKIQNLIKNTGH